MSETILQGCSCSPQLEALTQAHDQMSLFNLPITFDRVRLDVGIDSNAGNKSLDSSRPRQQ